MQIELLGDLHQALGAAWDNTAAGDNLLTVKRELGSGGAEVGDCTDRPFKRAEIAPLARISAEADG